MLLRRNYGLPSLTTATFGFVIFFALAGLAATMLVVERRLDSVGSAVQSESVYLRGEALRMNLAKALEREWNSVNAVSGTLRVGDARAARPRLTAISKISGAIAWTGIADARGQMVASSQPVLEGEDVSGSRWFRRGLAGSHIGAAETGDRLARLVPGEGDERLQYIDLATAIRGPDQRVEGVLIYRLNVGWMQSYLAESAEVLDLDLFMVDGRGRVLFDHTRVIPEGLSSRAAQLVASGQQGTFRVPYDAENDVFLAALPRIVAGDMASLDWRLVARVPTRIEGFGFGPFLLSREIMGLLLGFGTVLLLGTVLFCRYFLQPLQVLSRDAQTIAAGGDVYPSEQRSSREAELLSAAIVQIQKV